MDSCARLVGGSSAINVGLYTRGPNRELDEWESSYGCKGWNHKDLQRYLDVPFCNDMSSSVKTSRDGKGPWEYSFGKKHQYVLTEKVFSTLDSMGLGRIDNDPYKHDEKKGPIGSGCFTFQSAVSRDGKKVHAGNAYLTDAILRSRSNLTVRRKLYYPGQRSILIPSLSRSYAPKQKSHRSSLLIGMEKSNRSQPQV